MGGRVIEFLQSFAAPKSHRVRAIQLKKYGHRCTDEFDIATPRWRETPELVKVMARTLGPAVHDPATATNVRRRAEATLGKLPWPRRAVIGWLVAKARDGFRIREFSKSAFVATVGAQRHVMLEFGRRLVTAGHLDAPDDVFVLTAADIGLFASGEWNGRGARALAADRRRQWQAWRGEDDPGDVILEEPAGRVSHVSTPHPNDGTTLRGLGVSPGRAKGPARKLAAISEADKLREGGVLVARSTDPSWTPLFLSAQGIVVEIGGYLSHGAIVAREFGLPAVVNAPGSFSRIANGEPIIVDGDSGEIELLYLTSSASP